MTRVFGLSDITKNCGTTRLQWSVVNNNCANQRNGYDNVTTFKEERKGFVVAPPGWSSAVMCTDEVVAVIRVGRGQPRKSGPISCRGKRFFASPKR